MRIGWTTRMQKQDSVGEMEIRHEQIRGDGVELHVARAGEGPPVVLLHGFPENWTSWRHQLAPLVDAGFSVLAPDLRGYHLSGRPAEQSAYQLHHLVADVAALVQNAGYHRTHLVGHDWGGVIAWAFAAAHPELLRRMVILNAPHIHIYLKKVRRPPQMLRSWYVGFFQLPMLPEWVLSAGGFAVLRQMFARTPARKGAFSKEAIDQYIEPLSRSGALTAALNYYRANLPLGVGETASAAVIDVETLVIWGERDPALGVELLDGLDQFAPHVRVERLSDVGHWVQNEAPEEVNRLLLQFLQQREPT